MPDRGKRRSSQAAHNGELRYSGHEFFAAESLRARVEQVLWTYSQCQLRVKAKQGLFVRVDLGNVWIVGYDIGAQTAAALIGERTDVAVPATNKFKPHGAILISPSVDVSPGKLQDRYRPSACRYWLSVRNWMTIPTASPRRNYAGQFGTIQYRKLTGR